MVHLEEEESFHLILKGRKTYEKPHYLPTTAMNDMVEKSTCILTAYDHLTLKTKWGI